MFSVSSAAALWSLPRHFSNNNQLQSAIHVHAMAHTSIPADTRPCPCRSASTSSDNLEIPKCPN